MSDLVPIDTSRRRLLKIAAVGSMSVTVLAGCGGGGPNSTAESPPVGGGTPPPPPPPAPGPGPVPEPPPPVPPPPTTQGGTWQALTVAAHARKVIGESFATGSTFDPRVAELIDARAESTVSAIPYRSFCRPVMGEPGILYYNGSLHSNYPGNEIDRIDLRNLLSNEVTTTINHQPRVPPQGVDSGYGSGSGAYVYAQYGSGLGAANRWQPYAHHTWTKNGWHPTWGWFSQVVYARDEGATLGPNPLGAGSNYAQASSVAGVVSYDFSASSSESRYRVRLPTAPGTSGASDWNQHRMSVLFLETDNGSIVTVKEVTADLPSPATLFTFDSSALSGNTWGFFPGTSGNGILVKWLEASKYLCLRVDSNRFPGDAIGFDTYHTVFLLNLTDPVARVRRLRPPAGALEGISVSADGNLTFCVDRNSRRVYWMVYKADPGPNAEQFARFYRASFDDLEGWTQILTEGFPAIRNTTFQAGWIASKRETMWFYNGYLFLILPEGGGPSDPGYTNGAINLLRMKVETSQEVPTMSFRRYDYAAQNFRFSHSGALQLIGSKHVNWAYRSADDSWYQCAGDFGESFCHSMGRLEFDDTARGYNFTEVLSELADPPAGTKRPASPDDGHWSYLGTGNGNPALADKFLYARGGDGTSVLSNIYIRRKYGGNENDPAQVAAARAAGWDTDKLMLFDPVSRTFSSLGADTWTQVTGGNPVYDSGHMGDKLAFSSWRTRCGAFDPSTNTLFRFVDQGALYLTAWNLDRRTITIYQTSDWTDPATGRRWFSGGPRPQRTSDVTADGFGFFDAGQNRYYTDLELHWEHKAMWIDPSTGKLYCVAPKSGVLWCFETRSPRTTGDGKASVVFYPVGERIPVPASAYVGMTSLNTYPPVRVTNDSAADARMNSFLLPFKGGLLWLSSLNYLGGVAGQPLFAFWRRLDYTGAWSVVTMPQEFAANAPAARTPDSIFNEEILAISQAYTDLDDRPYYRYFWRIT
jgi:hypothetical protein